MVSFERSAAVYELFEGNLKFNGQVLPAGHDHSRLTVSIITCSIHAAPLDRRVND